MALLRRHRLPVSLLLSFLFTACRGAPSGDDDSYNPSMCLQSHRCGNISNSYPFYLYNETTALLGKDYCGYPGLGIQCKDDKQAVLLLSDGNYTVSNISYTDFTESLVDQEVFHDESCPRIDHNVTLPQNSGLSYPNSPVDPLVFFLNCSRDSSSFSTAGPSFVLRGNEFPPENCFGRASLSSKCLYSNSRTFH